MNKIYLCNYYETWAYGGFQDTTCIAIAPDEQQAIDIAFEKNKADCPSRNIWTAEEISANSPNNYIHVAGRSS